MIYFVIPKMGTPIDEIVRTYSIQTGSDVVGIPYARTYGVKQRFSVNPQRLGEFLNSLCDLCDEDIHIEQVETPRTYEALGLPFAEVIGSRRTIPIIATFKFSFRLTEFQQREPSLYSEEFIKNLVETLQDVVNEKIETTPTYEQLIATVEESSPWTLKDITYVMIKVQFPYTQVDLNYQRRRLKNFFIEALNEEKMISGLECQPTTTDWNTIVQDIGDVVPMYRCKLDQSDAPMSFFHLYRFNGDQSEEIPLDLALFNPVNFSRITRGMIPESTIVPNYPLIHWLPLFLSIDFCARESAIRGNDLESSDANENSIEYDASVASKEPLAMIRNLLPLLNSKRFNIEPFWKDICQAIFSATQGSEDGLEIFISATINAAQEEGRDRDSCIRLYRQCQPNGVSVKTIGWYAREDSPKEYARWHELWAKNSLVEALSCIHDDVAEAIYREFWLDFMCSGLSKNSWYKFANNRLVPQDDAVDLRQAITNDLVPIYKRLRGKLNNESQDEKADPDQRGKAENGITRITKLIAKLGTQGFKTSVVRATQEKFYVPEFEKYKDADPSKTGWLNCVVVCCEKEAIVVSGKPEDYITKSTWIPYPFEMTPEHPKYVELMAWLSQVFPKPDLLHFFLKVAASFLYGRNAEKLFQIWSGEGDNSKSMIVKLFQAVLGMYCVDFPVGLIIGRIMGNSSGPTPELAQAQGARVGFVCEPEGNEQIREGAVKRYTGGDRFFTRFLNQNGGSVDAMFKLVLMCNRIPEFTAMSKALHNRLLHLPFLSTWVDNPPEDPAEQMKQCKFKKDPFFDKKIPGYAQAFGYLIVRYYAAYKQEGLIPPTTVVEHTEKYWRENDLYQLFIDEKLSRPYLDAEKKVVNENASLSATEIYPEFQRWYRQTYPGTEIPNLPSMRENLIQRLGPQKTRRWYGIQINQQLATI